MHSVHTVVCMACTDRVYVTVDAVDAVARQ